MYVMYIQILVEIVYFTDNIVLVQLLYTLVSFLDNFLSSQIYFCCLDTAQIESNMFRCKYINTVMANMTLFLTCILLWVS